LPPGRPAVAAEIDAPDGVIPSRNAVSAGRGNAEDGAAVPKPPSNRSTTNGPGILARRARAVRGITADWDRRCRDPSDRLVCQHCPPGSPSSRRKGPRPSPEEPSELLRERWKDRVIEPDQLPSTAAADGGGPAGWRLTQASRAGLEEVCASPHREGKPVSAILMPDIPWGNYGSPVVGHRARRIWCRQILR
jgi:hypothetical protein